VELGHRHCHIARLAHLCILQELGNRLDLQRLDVLNDREAYCPDTEYEELENNNKHAQAQGCLVERRRYEDGLVREMEMMVIDVMTRYLMAWWKQWNELALGRRCGMVRVSSVWIGAR